jgi:hypothetical protein
MKGQYTLAAAYIDDKTAFGKYDTHRAGFGPRGRAKTSYACEQRSQGDV